MSVENHEDPRRYAPFEDLDETARQGRCAMIWWYSQATILLPMHFQYPEAAHERAGQGLTAHVDAEARAAKARRAERRSQLDSVRFGLRVEAYLRGKPHDDTLASTLAKIVASADGAESHARGCFRRRAHWRLTWGRP